MAAYWAGVAIGITGGWVAESVPRGKAEERVKS